MRTARRKSIVVSVAGVLLVAAAAAAAWFALHRTAGAPPATSTISTAPAPSAVRASTGFANPRLRSVGVSADGWLGQDAALSLAGGAPGVLSIRADVPRADGQHVTVIVGDRPLSSEPVAGGPLDLRLLVPASRGNRRIELRFARTIKLKPPDNRSAAAQLKSIAVAPVRKAPRTLRIPADLSRTDVITNGIEADGWTGADATVALAGGAPATLSIHGLVPRLPHNEQQRLRLDVNGATVLEQGVQPGGLDVRVPIGSSGAVRNVELRWSRTAPLSSADPRRLAARITSIALAPLHGVAHLQLPAALAKGNVTYTGIYADGWAQKDARVVLTGGSTAKLSVDAVTQIPGQHVTVLVDGVPLVTTELAEGRDSVDVPLTPSSLPRVLELRFARVAPIAGNDPRPAAALLRQIRVAPIGASAPGAVQIPSDLAQADLVYSGVYRDGWAEPDVRMVIAGGAATTLTVKAQTAVRRQRVTVSVDGRELGGVKLPAGRDLVRVGLRATTGPRLLELQFARAAQIAPNDPRLASTLLRSVVLKRFARTGNASASPSFRAVLSMAAEVPPLTGNAAGTFTASLSGTALHWRLDMHGLSGPIVAAVIHVGGDGAVGPTLADLCRPCSDAPSGTLQLSDSGAAAIRDGRAYVNVGTSQHPYGEIRGPILGG